MACCGKRPEPNAPRKFVPKLTKKGVTRKFWARHELRQEDPNNPRVEHFIDAIEAKKKFDRRDHTFVPYTENQVYGWLERLAPRFTEQLDRDVFNKRHCIDEEWQNEHEIAITLYKQFKMGQKR